MEWVYSGTQNHKHIFTNLRTFPGPTQGQAERTTVQQIFHLHIFTTTKDAEKLIHSNEVSKEDRPGSKTLFYDSETTMC